MSSEKVITTIKEQVKLDAWQREMEEQQSSGLSVKTWCKERGLSQSAYYHRFRKSNCPVSGHPSQLLLPGAVGTHHLPEVCAGCPAVPASRCVLP